MASHSDAETICLPIGLEDNHSILSRAQRNPRLYTEYFSNRQKSEPEYKLSMPCLSKQRCRRSRRTGSSDKKTPVTTRHAKCQAPDLAARQKRKAAPAKSSPSGKKPKEIQLFLHIGSTPHPLFIRIAETCTVEDVITTACESNFGRSSLPDCSLMYSNCKLPAGFTLKEIGLEERANLHFQVSLRGGVRDPPDKSDKLDSGDHDTVTSTETPTEPEASSLGCERTSADGTTASSSPTDAGGITDTVHVQGATLETSCHGSFESGIGNSGTEMSPRQEHQESIPVGSSSVMTTVEFDLNCQVDETVEEGAALLKSASMAKSLCNDVNVGKGEDTNSSDFSYQASNNVVLQTDVVEMSGATTDSCEPTSTPSPKSHCKITMPPRTECNVEQPLYCSECFDEDTGDTEVATKLCLTCDGKAFCSVCFTFLHKKRRQRDHVVQEINQTMSVEGTDIERENAETRRTAEYLDDRFVPLNAKDTDLQKTLLATGRSLVLQETALFQFMQVVEDEGDSGMVEKVINVQEEIVRFCKVMRLDSCSFSDLTTIDFRQLDKDKITVTGIYGESSALQRFLTDNLGMNPETVLLFSTTTSELSAGVYAFCPNRESVFLFYWSKEIPSSSYSTSSVSCQCVRYLQRLCHSLVVLFDDTESSSLQLDRVRHQEQATYTDMKVSQVLDCKETVSIHPGFTAEARCLVASETSKDWKAYVFSTGKEGFTVCIPRQLRQEKESKLIVRDSMSLTHYKEKFSEHIQQFHVDFSALGGDNKQLRAFLRLTLPQSFKNLSDKEKRIENINSSLESELAKVKTEAEQERLQVSTLWKRGVAHLFSELCPDEDKAIGLWDSSHSPGIEEDVVKEPLLCEAFKLMPSRITEAVADLRKKAALVEVLCEMNEKTKQDFSFAGNLITEFFPSEVTFSEALHRATTPNVIRRLWNIFTKQGIDRNHLECKVRSKMDERILPTQRFVYDKFISTYKKQIRQYYVSIQRAKIPKAEEMVRARNEQLKLIAKEEQMSSAIAPYREKLLQVGVNMFKSQFKFRVKLFELNKSDVVISYEEERLSEPEIGYDVHHLRLKQADLNQMQKQAQFSARPSLHWIDNAHVRLKKDVEELRGLYWIQSQKKALALVYNKDGQRLFVYVGSWRTLTKRHLRFFPRDCDAHAFDANKRLLALSNTSEHRIVIFQMTECYSQLTRYNTCSEIVLSGLCPPSFAVKQLQVLEGQDELLIVGTTSQGYVYDMKRRRLQSSFFSFARELKRVFTIPGYVLEVIEDSIDNVQPNKLFLLRVYSNRSCKVVKTIPLQEVTVENVDYIQLLDLGFQVHLCIPIKDGQVKSFFVEATTPESHLQFMSKRSKPVNAGSVGMYGRNSLLECFYRIFYKYPIRHCYENVINPLILFCVCRNWDSDLEGRIYRYMEDMFQELEEETGKGTGPLLEKMEIVTCTAEDCSKLMMRNFGAISIGRWIKELISAVPIQIARAEGDRLLPLSKGMNLSLDWSCADVADVINAISFGLYEALFKGSTVPVKVLSAKGRQSVGKSYLLNHVAGAQFDIEGGRCTHGVWMTARVLPDVFLVVLDFEGLGSFERTRQEDVLLAVFGAAVSNLTVFKTDCRFDRDTEAMFDRLQDGAKLLKSGQQNKLFKGKLAIVVRDVSKSAAEATIEHFLSKIEQVCQAHSTSNFVCNLYDGEYRVATSQPMGNSQFLQSFERVKDDLNRQCSTYDSPVELMGVLKTLMAKIHLQDWSPIDKTRIVQKINLLKRNLMDAATFGAFADPAAGSEGYEFLPLCKFGNTNAETIPDVWDGKCSKPLGSDTGLQLLSAQDEADVTKIRDSMIAKFRELELAQGLEVGGKDWLKELTEYFSALACRRIQRVQVWIHTNTEGYTDGEEVQQLLAMADSEYFKLLRQVWSLCGEKCDSCNRLCVSPKYHKRNMDDDEKHACGTKHTCPAVCSFCEDGVTSCGYVALHTGDHHCLVETHTCGEPCSLEDRPGCNGFCSLSSGHLQKEADSKHKCDADIHYCGKLCDLESCRNICYYPYNVPHERHQCNTNSGCPFECEMSGCSVMCSNTNHFHSLDCPDEHHFCDNAHICPYQCEQAGLCGIDVQLVSVRPSKVLAKFRGRRGIYEYQLFSQQIKVKKKCGNLIPQGQFSHEGQHIHAGPRGEFSPKHFCNKQCNGCLRYCEKEYGHSGRHDTTHGNMSRQVFVSSERSFYIGDREYEQGESAIAELCDHFCKRRGRGHTHVVVCKTPSTCTSTSQLKHNQMTQGAQWHESTILDEVTHDFYWEEMDFEDPCTSTEQENFRKCNAICERATVEGAVPKLDDSRSHYYCQLSLWHRPVTPGKKVDCGHVSVRGHHFYCTHDLKYQYHSVLVIDQSGSMNKSDDTPQHQMLLQKEEFNNRLGAVLEACHTFVETRYKCSDGDRFSLITFSRKATTVVSGQKVSNGLLMSLVEMDLKAEGSTHFAEALKTAREVINRVADSYPSLSPLVIMLSDGLAHDQGRAVRKARDLVSGCPKVKDRPVIHTIKFGLDTRGNKCLQELATIGNGEMHLAKDKFELADQFREFNELMTQGIVGTIRNIPPAATGLLDREGESWFPHEAAVSEGDSSVALQILENGNDLYQICGARHVSGNMGQKNRISPLNLRDSGTIGDSLSVVFSIRHMGEMYRLKCLLRKKIVEDENEVVVDSSELECLKRLGVHQNIESIRHSFEDRSDIAFPWLNEEARVVTCDRASFIVVDCYDQSLREFAEQRKVDDHPLAEAFGIGPKGLVMLTLQLCDALSYLAHKNTIHGSISADNVFLRRSTEPVLCNFESSVFTKDIAAVRKTISAKRRNLGVTCDAPPELAVKPDVIAVDTEIKAVDCIIQQVIKMDMFGLGVMMYNLLLPGQPQMFPTIRPYVENRLPELWDRFGSGFRHLLFNMVRRDPALRISANEALLACQLLLSDLDVDQDAATETTCAEWLKAKKKGYVVDETVESDLTKKFLEKARFKEIFRVSSMLKPKETTQCKASCSFSGDESLHLHVRKGDLITKIETINSSWSFGYCRERCGRFHNYCLKKSSRSTTTTAV